MKQSNFSTIPTMILLVYSLGTAVFFRSFSRVLPDVAGALVGVTSFLCLVLNLRNDCKRFPGASSRPGNRGGPVFRISLTVLSFTPTAFFAICLQLFLGNALIARDGAPKAVLAAFAAVSFVCFLINDRNDRARLAAKAAEPPPLPAASSGGHATDSSAPKWLLPVGRSPWAVAAGYLGLVSFLLLPAPFALLFGILGLLDIRRNPQLCGKGRAWLGVVAGALFTAVIVAGYLGLFSKE